jgi:hypothetical protein
MNWYYKNVCSYHDPVGQAYARTRKTPPRPASFLHGHNHHVNPHWSQPTTHPPGCTWSIRRPAGCEPRCTIAGSRHCTRMEPSHRLNDPRARNENVHPTARYYPSMSTRYGMCPSQKCMSFQPTSPFRNVETNAMKLHRGGRASNGCKGRSSPRWPRHNGPRDVCQKYRHTACMDQLAFTMLSCAVSWMTSPSALKTPRPAISDPLSPHLESQRFPVHTHNHLLSVPERKAVPSSAPKEGLVVRQPETRMQPRGAQKQKRRIPRAKGPRHPNSWLFHPT